jgi:hypothetical protein
MMMAMIEVMKMSLGDGEWNFDGFEKVLKGFCWVN